MAEGDNGLVGLQGLHQDLVDLEQGRLREVDRLWADLEARIQDFRQLLDKPSENEQSKRTLLSGVIAYEGEDYTVNQEFQENATQLADVLDLDELHSAGLLLESQQDALFLEKSNLTSAAILFHEKRHFLLECLRLLLRQSTDPEGDDFIREPSRELVAIILDIKDGPARNGSLYTQKCLDHMVDIEKWLQNLGERRQGAIALGQTVTDEQSEILDFQQKSLGRQHESLGAIVYHLVKASRTGVEDFHKLLSHLPKVDRWSNLAVHYVPVIMAFTWAFGSPEGGGLLRDARTLNSNILGSKDSNPWVLRNLQAATITWWLAEYSGWYIEQPTGSPVQNVDLRREAQDRSDAFNQALRDGAFECSLSICSRATPNEWYDPARHALIQLLLPDALPLAQDLSLASTYFQDLLMEQFETFTDALITNMPDTLRHFKVEEDDQRKYVRTHSQQGASTAIPEQVLHLERFLVIVSFAYEHRPDAAQSFWVDVDSNLYGFLQWASKRQSTPSVSAFCEMFRSISGGEDCATSAHQFLLEEATPVSAAKIRRSHSLSWAQIFGELNVYTAKIREHPTALRPTIQYGGRPGPDEIDEPESFVMLESYLRLTSHLCRQSPDVRLWILSQSDFPIIEILFYLCNSSVPSSLQACSFTVIQALLTDKSLELSIDFWSTLDLWVSGGMSPPKVSRAPKASPVSRIERATLDSISRDFDTANEFIALLHSLVSPAIQDTGLNDQLPFSESLGSSYRMAGIEPYVDFVFGKVFASTDLHLDDKLRQRILVWNVLRFAIVCLQTFNEDLVILANRYPISVDEAMNTSSLLAYVRLHPFARVMEWMFNEHVLAALFASAHHDIDEVADTSPDSPLVLSLQCSIEVMNLILDHQSTYLDIVRPLIKLHAPIRKVQVLNPSLASFEDSVLLNLQLVVDLGLYSGIGIQDLTIASLKLLGKLTSSKKLNIQSNTSSGHRLGGNQLIGIVEQNASVASIASSLTLALQFDSRELSLDIDAPGWSIKVTILDFLIQCLSSFPDRPTLAHALLGFACTGENVDVEPDGTFANGAALFHAILHLVIEYPEGQNDMIERWSISLKQKGMQLLSILWNSPLTSIFVLAEMRLRDALFILFTRQTPVGPNTLWDGRLVVDPEFLFTESAESLDCFFRQRCLLFEYVAMEFRLIVKEGAPSMKGKIFATLLGSTNISDGVQVQNMSIFDLLDIIELEPSLSIAKPQLNFFAKTEFGLAVEDNPQRNSFLSDIKLINEMIILRFNNLQKAGRFQDINENQQADVEAQHILLHAESRNSQSKLVAARMQTLTAWANLLTLAVGACDLGHQEKSALILQAAQLVTPKLEEYAMSNADEAKEIARLISALLFQFDFGSSALDRSRVGDMAHDRLFQIFRTALRATIYPNIDTQLREILYKICYQYLSGMSGAPDASTRCRQIIQTVKSTGEKSVDTICDDAYGASGTCRVSALLLLDALASLSSQDKSNCIIQTLTRTNFIQILVEGIQIVPRELRNTNARDIPLLLTYYESKLALLLTISQSRAGATQVANAGLFPAIHSSGLFAMDPDIGVEIDNPEALAKYYRLLLSISRIITAVVLARGPHNEQTIENAKAFLIDNRPLVVATFKRQARIGVSFDDAGVDIEELVELFTLLIEMTDFLDYDEKRDTQKARKVGIFT